jgi:hypothetical protein
LDCLCDTSYTLAVGVLQWLCNGWAYPYSARHRGHCPDSRPHSEKKVLACLEEARRAGRPRSQRVQNNLYKGVKI